MMTTSKEPIKEELEDVAAWLSLVARALEHPEFEEGKVLFSTSDIRPRAGLPISPQGCKSLGQKHVSMTLSEAADTVGALRDKVAKLAAGLGR